MALTSRSRGSTIHTRCDRDVRTTFACHVVFDRYSVNKFTVGGKLVTGESLSNMCMLIRTFGKMTLPATKEAQMLVFAQMGFKVSLGNPMRKYSPGTHWINSGIECVVVYKE